MEIKPDGKRGLFPDLAPYGPVRHVTDSTQPDKQKTTSVETAQVQEEWTREMISPRHERNSNTGSSIHQNSQEKSTTRRIKRPKVTKKVIVNAVELTLSIFCIGILINLFVSWRHTIPPALPTEAISSLNYQIYYPTQMPAGYRYKKDSANSHNGLLFYKFVRGKNVITVTEQTAPPKSINLYKISGGYTKLNIPLGDAGVGTSVGNPAVMIITDTTLINITSSKGVAKDQVISLAKKMKLFVPPDTL